MSMKTNKVYANAFATQECDYIIEEAERLLEINDAIIGEKNGKTSAKVRQSKTGWISHRDPNHNDLWNWLSGRLWNLVHDANRTNFDFDTTYLESIQYTIYESGGDHYDWHIDTFLDTDNAFHRKLSLTLQLTDGSEYEGGDFQLKDGTNKSLDPAIRNKGTVLIFPSFLMHRVTPVTSGIRKTIVCWFEGSKFK